ncbi:MAG: TlpA family protein disulfide reductase [Pyrinomonadaceae bacterium]|nr:TlpA family protein disulfide reductase [Pyrinomonadaceae bacterium]
MKYKFTLFFVGLWLLCSLTSAQEIDNSAKLNLYNDLLNTEISIINQKETLKLKDVKNKVIIAIFWASWCGPCVRQAMDLQIIKTEFQKDDLFLIGLNADPEDKDDIYRFLGKRKAPKSSVISGSATADNKDFLKALKQNKFNYPLGFVKEDLFGSLLKVSKKDAIPQIIIINNGEIKEIYVGANRTEKIQQNLKEIFAQK